MQEDLKGAHHLTALAEGSDPAQGNAEGSGPVQGIEGNGLAQGNAGGSGPAQGTGGSGLAQGTAGGTGPVQGTAEGSAHAQETAGAVHPMTEGVETGPDHPPRMGTVRQTRKRFPSMEPFRFETSRDCVNNGTCNCYLQMV
jgi:hypothetical protein